MPQTNDNVGAEAKRAALYARVSTVDERQDPETQLQQLREYAERRGCSAAGEFVDTGSGLDQDRPAYQQLRKAARRREIDVVLVWCYDRFARSTQALVNALKEFEALGVDFISCQEQIDTTTPQGEMVFGFMASLAQFESSLISERVKAGMQRAKEERRKGSTSDVHRFPKTHKPRCSGFAKKRTCPSTRSPSVWVLRTAPLGTTCRNSRNETILAE